MSPSDNIPANFIWWHITNFIGCSLISLDISRSQPIRSLIQYKRINQTEQ